MKPRTDGNSAGLEIAATQDYRRKGAGDWMVPSQSAERAATASVTGAEGFRCACPDFELRGQTCKHGFAVEFFLRRETKPDGTVIETRAARVTYSQNWTAYNAAQTSEKEQFCTLLRDLVADVPSPEQKRGRPSLPLSDMIFAAAFKVYSTVSGRRFMTDLRDAHANGPHRQDAALQQDLQRARRENPDAHPAGPDYALGAAAEGARNRLRGRLDWLRHAVVLPPLQREIRARAGASRDF